MNNELLRHALATICYRFKGVLDRAGPGFADFTPGNGIATPHELVRQMQDLAQWTSALLRGAIVFENAIRLEFSEQVGALTLAIQDLDLLLETIQIEQPLARRLLQGPMADLLTQIGQLSLLRRQHGDILKVEDYSLAEITAGKFD